MRSPQLTLFIFLLGLRRKAISCSSGFEVRTKDVQGTLPSHHCSDRLTNSLIIQLVLGFSVVTQLAGLMLSLVMALSADLLLNTYLVHIVEGHGPIYASLNATLAVVGLINTVPSLSR